MKYILVLLIIVFLSGCTTVVPPVTEYRIVTSKPNFVKNDGVCRDKSLKVAQPFSQSSLMSKDMNYAQGETKQYAYSQAQWSESPNIFVGAELLNHIRATKLFKSVLNSKSRTKSDLILEINIEDFMQYFNEDSTKSYCSVVIELTLLDSKNSKVIATQNFKARVDAKTLDANGGVEALSKALEKVIAQSVKWIGGVCK